MKRWEIKEEEVSIVVIGSFNPSIFHPEWFIRHGITEEWEYSDSEVIITPDFSRFTLPGERQLEVVQNRFLYKSPLESSALELGDLVSSTFSLLSHTPVSQLGLNYKPTIHIPDKDDWYEFGEKLAPTLLWKKAAPYLDDLSEEKKKTLGLQTLKMSLPRSDDISGAINADISNLRGEETSLLFGINFHFDITSQKATDAIEIIENQWDDSLKQSRQIIETVIELHFGENR